MEQLTDCFESINPDEDLWLQAIRRVFKGKALLWFRENKDDFTSWRRFAKHFRDRFIGLLDEDDLYDELKNCLQLKNESIDEFISTVRYMAHRLRQPLSTREQVKIAYKNLLPEYRKYINGRDRDSFSDLIRYGRVWKKEKGLDERQSHLTGRKTEKAAAISELSEEQEKNPKVKKINNLKTRKIAQK